MKQHSNNSKVVYHAVKKRKQKPINRSQKSSSEMNDDSLDMMENTEALKSRLTTNINDEINEEDMKQLRACISNQFKKSNFINFSLIKSRGNATNQLQSSKRQLKPEQNLAKQPQKPAQNFKQTTKRHFLTCHNRSQSCPFIEPTSVNQNMEFKDNRVQEPQIVFSSTKLDFKQKKKISMQYLSKNKNRFNNLHMKGVPHHNYSNSLTQSSNTVIVHNIPIDYQQNLISTTNLSNILYHKQEAEHEDEDQDTKVIEEIDSRSMNNGSVIERKTVIFNNDIKHQIIEPLEKVFIEQISTKPNHFIQTSPKPVVIDRKSLFALKTKIRQQISQYQIQQQKKLFQIHTQAFTIRQSILNNFLNYQPKTQSVSKKQCLITSVKLLTGSEDKKVSLKNIQKGVVKK